MCDIPLWASGRFNSSLREPCDSLEEGQQYISCVYIPVPDYECEVVILNTVLIFAQIYLAERLSTASLITGVVFARVNPINHSLVLCFIYCVWFAKCAKSLGFTRWLSPWHKKTRNKNRGGMSWMCHKACRHHNNTCQGFVASLRDNISLAWLPRSRRFQVFVDGAILRKHVLGGFYLSECLHLFAIETETVVNSQKRLSLCA